MRRETWCGVTGPDHIVKTCRDCQNVYKRSRYEANPREIRPAWHETALNRRVSAKNARCQERGGCTPSQNFIWRDSQHVPTCVRCDVPMMRRVSVWRGYAA